MELLWSLEQKHDARETSTSTPKLRIAEMSNERMERMGAQPALLFLLVSAWHAMQYVWTLRAITITEITGRRVPFQLSYQNSSLGRSGFSESERAGLASVPDLL